MYQFKTHKMQRSVFELSGHVLALRTGSMRYVHVCPPRSVVHHSSSTGVSTHPCMLGGEFKLENDTGGDIVSKYQFS